MSNDNLNMDIDSLLDGTLDDLADMPAFKPFTPGTHVAILKLEIKKIGENQAVEAGFKHKETIEQADPTATPVTPGDETSVLFFLKHPSQQAVELGQGQFKEIMKAAAEKFGPNTNRELMAQANGSEVTIVTGLREDKKKGKTYTSLTALVFN